MSGTRANRMIAKKSVQIRMSDFPANGNTRDIWRVTHDPLRLVEEGEVMVRLDYISIDPGMRGWITNKRSYMPPVKPGGVMRAFGHSGAVKSPTYTLVEPYEFDGRMVYHFDLYRLGEPEELEYMGIRDYFTDASVCLVEWPIRGQGVLPVADLVVTLGVTAPGRTLNIRAQTERGEQLVANVEKALSQI